MTDGTEPSSSNRNAKRRSRRRGRSTQRARKLYAALDLGTNNCRLLVATPHNSGFRVVDGFSRIVRLGEELEKTGELSSVAMDRALEALKSCTHIIGKSKVKRVRAVATQACRIATNGKEFVERVRIETGVSLKIISTEEEARLALRGCHDLIDHQCEAALVVDIGGGSTEISWVKLNTQSCEKKDYRNNVSLSSWVSLNLGVVTLAERFPEREDRQNWYAEMVNHAQEKVANFTKAEQFREAFNRGNVHYIGTSGAVTSLGGVHLDLPSYNRSKVDGMWLDVEDTDKVIARLLAHDLAARANEPCIGEERADLVLAGCAILQAVQREWPAKRIRVADRGLREGLLLSMMAFDRKRRGPRGRRR